MELEAQLRNVVNTSDMIQKELATILKDKTELDEKWEELRNILNKKESENSEAKQEIAKNKIKLQQEQEAFKNERSRSMDLIRKQQQEMEGKQKQQAVKDWLEQVVGETLDDNLEEAIRDGTVLCRAINGLHSNAIKKFHKSPKMPAMCMENLETFLKSCTTLYRIPQASLFHPSDLYNGENMTKVIGVLFDLSKKAASPVSPR